MFADVRTSEVRQERLERYRKSPESIVLPSELEVHDLMIGADPFVHYDPGTRTYSMPWYQDDVMRDGIENMALLRAERIEDLSTAFPERIEFASVSSSNKELWAPELHTFEGRNYLYIAESNGSNPTHRMQVYESKTSDVLSAYEYKGKLSTPDDAWAIDLTTFMIDGQIYGVWSGWESVEQSFPQNLYIAKMDTPWSFSGERHLLTEPSLPWMRSVEPILEGPQAFSTEGFVGGLTFSADASWTLEYTTGVLWYCGGDPLLLTSWSLHPRPLLPKGYGFGHGMFVPGKRQPEFLAHRKTSPAPGWDDRAICTISPNSLLLREMNAHAFSYR